MSKSLYSLILMDEVVKGIDKAAYSLNTSRSALINRILADYLSIKTPDSHADEVFGIVGRTLSESGDIQVCHGTSPSVLTLRSALNYKYNPTLRYTVTLTPDGESVSGRMEAALRTQNKLLKDKVGGFYHVWSTLMKNGDTDDLHAEKYYVSDAKYTVFFRIYGDYQNMSTSETASLIADYVRHFDNSIKEFFGLPEERCSEILLKLDYRKDESI